MTLHIVFAVVLWARPTPHNIFYESCRELSDSVERCLLMHIVDSTFRIGVDMLKLLEIKVKILNLRRKESLKWSHITETRELKGDAIHVSWVLPTLHTVMRGGSYQKLSCSVSMKVVNDEDNHLKVTKSEVRCKGYVEVNVKILSLLKWSHRHPTICVVEPSIVFMFWVHSPMLLLHMSLWCPFLSTYHSKDKCSIRKNNHTFKVAGDDGS